MLKEYVKKLARKYNLTENDIFKYATNKELKILFEIKNFDDVDFSEDELLRIYSSLVRRKIVQDFFKVKTEKKNYTKYAPYFANGINIKMIKDLKDDNLFNSCVFDMRDFLQDSPPLLYGESVVYLGTIENG